MDAVEQVQVGEMDGVTLWCGPLVNCDTSSVTWCTHWVRNRYPKWSPGEWNQGLNLWSPGGLILTRTHLAAQGPNQSDHNTQSWKACMAPMHFF